MQPTKQRSRSVRRRRIACAIRRRRRHRDYQVLAPEVVSWLRVNRPIATRLLALTKAWHEQPDRKVSAWLSRLEWEALWCQVNQLITPPRSAPTVRTALGWLAQLGAGEAWQGDPLDSVALWRGLQRLNDLTAMWRLCRMP